MKKQNIIMGISFVLLFVMVIGVSYAAYKFSAAGTKENVISTGTISMSYSQNSFIDLKHTYPKTDTYAIATKEDKSSMEFSVSMETSGTKQINYALAITNIEEGATLKSDKVKIYLEKEGKVVNNFETNKGQTIESFKNKYVEGLIDSYAIYQDILTTSNKTHHYILTSWIDESYILPIKNETTTTKQTNEETYKFKVKVVGVDTPITIKEKSNVTTGVDTLIALTNNKDDSGLYTITHAKDTTLQIGATEDITEYRYRGASPKNYVTFNNEVWRILGVFPTDDGTGNIENRIKIIKDQSIGNNYWNTVQVTSTSSYNNWTGATLMKYLNATYYNSLTNDNSIDMVDDVKYYLGGYKDVITPTPITIYDFERKISGSGTYFFKTNPTNWIGKVALMTASDYGYATENCEDKLLYNSDTTKGIIGCNSTNWLYNIKANEWLLNQYANSSTANTSVYYILNNGQIHGIASSINNSFSTRPVLYLKPEVQITEGDGTSSNPYKLSFTKNEDTSNANAPVLASNMIPVYYDATAKAWKKADVKNKTMENRWYNYENHMWANAVTVKEANRQTYLNASVGTPISMDDITTMWVWIPRFNAVTPSNYNGGTKALPNAIDVTFVKPNETAIDAFTFGTKQLSGFWYAKFELSHSTLASSSNSNSLGCTNEACSNANGIIIKPSVKSLRYNNISNFFFASRSMEQPNNSFGFVSSEVDTHMSKNNEWGAVAYLAQSIYGKCANSIACTEVGINNNSTYITGIGAEAGSSYTGATADSYDTAFGMRASTTGNIYGIYDMSGGAWDYVMGSYSKTIGSSGFTSSTFPNDKYFNNYTTSSYQGHALTETNGWYNDNFGIVVSSSPWFSRGSQYSNSTSAGVFSSYPQNGTAYSNISARFTLTNE